MIKLYDGQILRAIDNGSTFYYEGDSDIAVILPNDNSEPLMQSGWEIHIIQGDLQGQIKVMAQGGINVQCVGGKSHNFTRGPGAKISIQLLHEGGLYLLNGNNGPKS